jgi:hypothetical protein
MDVTVDLSEIEEVEVNVELGNQNYTGDSLVEIGPLSIHLTWEQAQKLYDALVEWFVPVEEED